MKHFFKYFLYAIALGLFVTSCSTDDDDSAPAPRGAYDNGYFILHEGGGLITPVTFVAEDGMVEANVFETVNPDAEPIGGFKQDVFFDATRAFITSGAGQTVTVVNRYTFEFIANVATDLQNPRYGAVVDGKAYVTNSGDFSTADDDYVTIIDLENYSTTTTVIGRVVDRIEAVNGKLFIANGSYGSGNSVTVLEPSDLSKTFIDLGMGNSPTGLAVANNTLYALTSNFSANGKIFEINTATASVESSVNLPSALTAPKHLDIDGNATYFTNGTSVYKWNIGSANVSDTAVLTYNSTSQYGSMYGFAVNNGTIYIADAGDFASAGSAYEYDMSGNLLTTITTDVAPNSFHFN